jgi:hypothetical protein
LTGLARGLRRPLNLPAMNTRLAFEILPQPDSESCGPTCLHAVYRYFGDEMPLSQVIEECDRLEEGGTLAVLLGCHALRRGYEATIYTYNLQVFDPTWFHPKPVPLAAKLSAQMVEKDLPKLRFASEGYLEFLSLGGEVRMRDLSRNLIREHLNNSIPILTGLSATYLYYDAREFGPQWDPDDIRGVPAGHFVVLCGYDRTNKQVHVADPYQENPLAPERLYSVGVDRVINAILLGILTYDANLLVIQPRKPRKR